MKWSDKTITSSAFTVDTSYTVTGLTANTTYYVTVTAFKSDEARLASNILSVSTTSCTRKYYHVYHIIYARYMYHVRIICRSDLLVMYTQARGPQIHVCAMWANSLCSHAKSVLWMTEHPNQHETNYWISYVVSSVKCWKALL